MQIDLTVLLEALDKEQTVTLATCAGRRVTIRPMSHVRRGHGIYFQTGERSLKMLQITENPHVAILCGTFEIEGTAAAQGRPSTIRGSQKPTVRNTRSPSPATPPCPTKSSSR